ncbi:MAG: hypothetical protein IJY83_03160 [Oscillospiraceae bacterium]|nr:hypothetical protein [Oscillospiraceae bacterium]
MNDNESIFSWEDIVPDDEKILWRGTPFVKTGILADKSVNLLFGSFLAIFFTIIGVASHISGVGRTMIGLSAFAVIFGLYVVARSVYDIAVGKSKIYAATDKRVICYDLRNGNIADVSYDKFNKIYTKVKKDNSGSLRLVFQKDAMVTSNYTECLNIEGICEPEKAAEIIKKAKLEFISDKDDDNEIVINEFETDNDYDELIGEAKKFLGDDVLWCGMANTGKLSVYRIIAGVLLFLITSFAILVFIKHLVAAYMNTGSISVYLSLVFIIPVGITMLIIALDPIIDIVRHKKLTKTLYIVTDKKVVSYHSEKTVIHEISQKSRVRISGNNIEVSGGSRKIKFVNIGSTENVYEIIRTQIIKSFPDF